MPRIASDRTEAIRSLLDETNGSITHGQARLKLKGLGFEVAKKPKHKSAELSAVDEYEYDVEGVKAALRQGDMGTVKAILEPVFKSTGFDEDVQKGVIKEMQVRLEFYDERNFYDVTKNNYKLANFNRSETAKSAKPSVSRKPTGTENQRARAAVTKPNDAPPPPKHKRHGTETVSEPKRGRGRPRKESVVVASEPKRGRGRPRKESVVVASEPKRGRPRKNSQPVMIRPTADELAALELIEKLGGVSEAETQIEQLRVQAEQLEQAIELVAQLTKRSDELNQRLHSAA